MDYLQYEMIQNNLKKKEDFVLNLIINGLPSILSSLIYHLYGYKWSFKPYYKWITFNTEEQVLEEVERLNCFKPYYKWITFNT